MKIVLNHYQSAMSFRRAMQKLTDGADGLSLAVSYLQVGGWELLLRKMRGINPQNVRIVFTDQMGITQPAAIRRALAHQVQIHNYSGEGTYHPKVYLSYDKRGRPRRFLVSSANLSHSAFYQGIEAGVLGQDRQALRTMHDWFQFLFNRQSREVSDQDLGLIEERWRQAAAARVKVQLQRRLTASITPPKIIPVATESDLDAIEDTFATIQLPIGLMNSDYARNNIRNLSHLRKVLGQWGKIRKASSGIASKQRS